VAADLLDVKRIIRHGYSAKTDEIQQTLFARTWHAVKSMRQKRGACRSGFCRGGKFVCTSCSVDAAAAAADPMHILSRRRHRHCNHWTPILSLSFTVICREVLPGNDLGHRRLDCYYGVVHAWAYTVLGGTLNPKHSLTYLSRAGTNKPQAADRFYTDGPLLLFMDWLYLDYCNCMLRWVSSRCYNQRPPWFLSATAGMACLIGCWHDSANVQH